MAATRSGILLESAARTAAVSSDAIDVAEAGSSLLVRINVTADPGTASITPTIEGWDPAAGGWYTVLTGTAITATGERILRVSPYEANSNNLVAADQVPSRFRFSMAVADTESMTYSVGFILS